MSELEITYNELMRDSFIRNSWLEPVMDTIKAKATMSRRVPEETFIELRAKLSYCPVENGVVVVTMPKIPQDKKIIFTGSVYDENMLVGFGPNQSGNREKPYTIVIAFAYKSLSEVLHVDREGFDYVLRRRGVNLSGETVAALPEGKLTVKLYENGKSFNEAVKNTEGRWYEQTPNEKGSFIPNRIIAKLVGDTLHVHAPQKKCKPHQRTFIIQ
ncbi:MAG: hypothetical protein IKK43_04120 [Clostridia bacterium]|nr:hypothetical protein [Clostridia bacterium]